MLSLKTINATALYAMKGLGDVQSGLMDSVNKLSSGLKISHARDDAARLRIGLDLQRQVTTLDAAVRNTMSAISMAQTADGALAGISDALIRLKELAVQGRDGALSNAQLKSITDEMEQIRREVNSIANRTTFNGRRLLTDEFGQWLSVIPDEVLDANWDGEYSDTDTVKVVITADGTDQVRLYEGVTATASTSPLSTILGYETSQSTWAAGQTDIAFSGTWAQAKEVLRDLEVKRGTGSGLVDVQIIPSDMHVLTLNGITSYYDEITSTGTWAQANTGATSRSFRGLTGYLTNITSQEENDLIKDKMTSQGWVGGSDSGTEGTWKWMDGPEAGDTFYTGNRDGAAGSLVGYSGYQGSWVSWNAGEPNNSSDEDYLQTNFGGAGLWNDLRSTSTLTTYIVEFGGYSDSGAIAGKQFQIDFSPTLSDQAPSFQVGAFTKSTYTATAFRDARIATNNRDSVSGDTFENLATRILDVVNTASSRTSSNFAKINNLVDDVITEIAARRTALGSMQNRLLATIQNDNWQSEGLQKSRSMVMETDFAAETARLTRMQIGQQAATAAMAQANAMPNVVLALLK